MQLYQEIKESSTQACMVVPVDVCFIPWQQIARHVVHVHASADPVAAAAAEAAGSGLPSVAGVGGGAQQQEVEQENWLKR